MDLKCPYPIYIDDEASDVKVMDIRAEAWIKGVVVGCKMMAEVFYGEKQSGGPGEVDIHPGSKHHRYPRR